MPALNAGPRIGLLGGSFNPAHEGHLHISRLALDYLRLDQVWWLVSPQNPLKGPADMAPLEARLASALVRADDPRIVATDLERELGTVHTAETLSALKARFPDHRFVWLMGADLLLQIPRWHRWRSIFYTVPVAVFARPPYSVRALSSRAARRFDRARIRPFAAGSLAARMPPAWVFLSIRPHAVSATRIRAHLDGARRRRN